MADQSRPSDGVIKSIVKCQNPECGQEFEAYNLRLIREYIGGTVRYLCPQCRGDARLQADAVLREMQVETLANQRAVWLGQSGIPLKFRDKNLDTFDATGNEVRVEAFRAWLEGFPLDKPPWGYRSLLIVSRNNGVGKTHLVCALLRAIVERFDKAGFENVPYRFWTANGAKTRLYDAQRFGSAETVAQVYEDFKTMWLLALDDVGKERLSGADAATTYETYYNLINNRYNANLPMVITSNLGLEPWDSGGMSLEDIIGISGVSRLREMTGGVQYLIEGEDRR